MNYCCSFSVTTMFPTCKCNWKAVRLHCEVELIRECEEENTVASSSPPFHEHHHHHHSPTTTVVIITNTAAFNITIPNAASLHLLSTLTSRTLLHQRLTYTALSSCAISARCDAYGLFTAPATYASLASAGWAVCGRTLPPDPTLKNWPLLPRSAENTLSAGLGPVPALQEAFESRNCTSTV